MSDNNQNSDCGCKKLNLTTRCTRAAAVSPQSSSEGRSRIKRHCGGPDRRPPAGLCVVDFHTQVGKQLDFAGTFRPLSRR